MQQGAFDTTEIIGLNWSEVLCHMQDSHYAKPYSCVVSREEGLALLPAAQNHVFVASQPEGGTRVLWA